MTDRIEWTTVEQRRIKHTSYAPYREWTELEPLRVRNWLIRHVNYVTDVGHCAGGPECPASAEDVVNWIKAAPAEVRERVLAPFVLGKPGAEAAYCEERVRRIAAEKERDAETARAIAYVEKADEMLREQVAEIELLRKRSTELQSQRDAIATELRSVASALGLSTDDTIESLAARCRTAVSLGSIGALRRRAERAESDRYNAQSARDVATSELALAKESIRNLEEEINGILDYAADGAERENRLSCERDQMKRELAEAKCDLVILDRSGLLPAGDGVPRERVREMLRKAVELSSPSWITAMSLEVLHVRIADRILDDYGSETKGDK